MGIANGSHKATQAIKKVAIFRGAVDVIRDTNQQSATCSYIAIGEIGKL
jgi:hypothetical protein